MRYWPIFCVLLLNVCLQLTDVEASPFHKAGDSCVGRCGQVGVNTTAPCQCNAACQTHNDCCSDFSATCSTCVSRCNAAVDTHWPCQCNAACDSNKDCCPDYTDLCSGGGSTVTNAELEALSKQLHTDDVNGVKGIVLDLQGKTTSGNTADLAPLPLFKSVPSTAFDGPTIKALKALYDNYDADCTVTEVVTQAEQTENDAFLDAMMATSVMQQAHKFLADKGLADADANGFKEYLRHIWMGLYNRGGGISSASGLEHVFVGEKDGNKIQGFHSWMRFYLQEQSGNMNYLGYMTEIKLGVGSMLEMPMKWDGIYKAISSISIASSPELDIALATVCFLARPNAKCPLMGSDGTRYSYQTYTIQCSGSVPCVGSAYPTLAV